MSPINSQKGISLLIIVLITTLILAVGLGISALIIQEMRMMSKIGYSVTAFYAADSGIEEALYDLYKFYPPTSTHSGDLGVGAHYDTVAVCSASTTLCPSGFIDDPNCDALNYCLKSAGSYKEVERAIEIKY